MTLSDLSAFLFPMRTHLVAQIQQQRCDFLVVIASKDVEIRRLRAELQSRDVRMSLLRPPDRTETLDVKKWAPVPMPLDWDGELKEMFKQDEEKPDGIPSE